MPSDEPVRVIFDSDLQTDCDDAGALAVLHALADRGEAEILGCVMSAANRTGPAAMDAINTWYGRPDIPLAHRRTGVNHPKRSKYTDHLAANFKHNTTDPNALPDPVKLYRQILADEPDGSVVVVTVGFLTNLAELLESKPDPYSPLNGKDLVAQKVKRWVCMGGVFVGGVTKKNWNWDHDPDSAMKAINNWPTPVLFAGRAVCSIPSPLRAGSRLSETPADNPVRVAYEQWFGGEAKDRHCADPATVLAAVREPQGYWEIETQGRIRFTDKKAHFVWEPSPDSDQAHLKAVGGHDVYTNADEISNLLEALMIQPPGLRR